MGVLLASVISLPLSSAYPSTFGTQVTPNPVDKGQTITITSYANASVGYVSAAEFHIDNTNPTPGTGTPMTADDGVFDSGGEPVTGTFDTGNLTAGNHTACVLARETTANNSTSWSTCSSSPTSTKVFVVNPPAGTPPTADAGGFYSGQPGVPVQFDGTGSWDPDGVIVAYAWTFGDGGSGAGATPQHTYAAAGYFPVYLTVTDDDGLTDMDYASANITGPAPPVAVSGGPYSGLPGLPITFDGNGSYDPDGYIVQYFWDFGDGSSAYGAVVVHTYAPPPANTTYEVCLRVTDNDGMNDTDCTPVDLTGGPANQAPVADAGPDQTGVVGEVLTFDGSGSFDSDGTIVEYYWLFSDGDSAFGVIVTHAFLTPSDLPGGNVTYHTACLRVTDDDGSQDWDCANVTVTDPLPGAPRILGALLSGTSDVRVRWQRSPDDGGGAGDVVSYEVLSGTAYSRTGAGYVLLATLPPGTMEYLHVGVGGTDSASHFYIVRAVDSFGGATRSVDQSGKFARTLAAGEQLVSVPLELQDWSVGSVFQTISWTRARTYVNPAGQGKNWLSNDKQKPWADLTTLSRTMAVWVKLSAGGIWAVAGLVPASTQVVLRIGWNFIGYASFTPQTVGQFLAGVSYQTVEGYAPNPPHNLQRLTGSSIMSAGNGYWVHVSIGAIVILAN